LKAVWDGLPDRAWFEGFFERDLEAVKSATLRRDELSAKLASAAGDLKRAEGELCGRIRRTMARDWTPEQIAAATASAEEAGLLSSAATVVCDGKEGA